MNEYEIDHSIHFAKISAYGEKKIKKKCTVLSNVKKITDYYPHANTIENLVQENNILRKKLEEFQLRANIKSTKTTILKSQLLIDLNELAGKKQKRYSKGLKLYSLYIFLIGGKMMYESLSLELGMPSISTIRNTFSGMAETEIEEGVPRYDLLLDYLKKNHYSMIVYGSEDQTKVKVELKYNGKFNTINGLVSPLDENGFPVKDTFKFTTIEKTINLVNTFSKAEYVNVIMIKSLQNNSIPFMLCLYGTNNKFVSEDVTNRWLTVKHELYIRGITLMGKNYKFVNLTTKF